jgi:OOP family OmpA-OmpF porin
MRVLILILIPLLLLGCGESSPPPQPTPAPVVEAPPPDADADGVIDSADQCDNTPAHAKVDATGCEGDTDADGVVDSMDSCPDTPVGEEVDAAGCKARLTVAREFTLKVEFASGSAKIVGDAASGVLRDVVALMNRYPETTVRIEGYTDSSGSKSGNQRVSLQRAEAVAKVLVDILGVDASRVSAMGFGDADPVATNDTAEGREQNRRVVAVVTPAE